MTTTAALYQFFSSFGINAYPVNSVPEKVQFPWLTYETTLGNWGDAPISIGVNLWYHTESEAAPNAKVKQISDAIGRGGVMLACDDGVIWVKRGEPWCNSLTDANDSTIKQRVLNISLEFLIT